MRSSHQLVLLISIRPLLSLYTLKPVIFMMVLPLCLPLQLLAPPAILIKMADGFSALFVHKSTLMKNRMFNTCTA
jgi:hypothetical protein